MLRRFLPRKLAVLLPLPAGTRALLVVGIMGLSAACGTGEPEVPPEERAGAEDRAALERGPDAEPGPETPTPTATEVPEGGLENWVEEMRQRLEVIELDPRASYPDVLRLYNSHHGAIERFYGEGGELTGDAHPELAAAIQRQDSAFHELLELTGTTHYIERTHLLHAIRNVRLAMEEVLDRARAAGLPLESTD